MKAVKMLAWILVLVGGLNWGLVGFFNFDLVATIFSGVPIVATTVYSLVGLSALMMIFSHMGCKDCHGCKSCGNYNNEGGDSSHV